MAHEPSALAGILISHLPKSNFVNGFASHCQLSAKSGFGKKSHRLRAMRMKALNCVRKRKDEENY